MSYWYVEGKGLRSGEWCENAYPLSAETYSHCKKNYELLDISVVDGNVVIKVDMAAYRKAALARVTNVDYVVVDNRKYFDDELPYMSADYFLRSGGPCIISKERMIKLVTERNREFTLCRSGIQSAKTPEEIDGYLKCQTP